MAERCTVEPTAEKIQVVPKGSDKAVTLERPQFLSQRITSTLTMWTGTTHLICVFEPLPSDRREGEDNVILVLLSATLLSTTAK